MPMSNERVTEILEHARTLVEPELRRAVATLTPEMRAPAEYHFGWTDRDGNALPGGGGKGIRPALAILSARAVAQTDLSLAVPGAAAVELVHNFSLLHDDIIDGDVERRHRETVWSSWSVGDAIIVGDALHALAFELLLDDVTPERVEAARRLAQRTTAMIAGQSADMSFDQREQVTFEDCLAMEANKTGALLAYSSSVGAILSGAGPDQVEQLDQFGASLGLAFQAVDDVLGIWGDPAVTGKAAGNDLRERKKSMPVTAALHSGHANVAEISALYAQEALSDDEIARLADLIDESGGRARTEAEAKLHLSHATSALDRGPLASDAREDLKAVAEFVVSRTF